MLYIIIIRLSYSSRSIRFYININFLRIINIRIDNIVNKDIIYT